MFDFWKFRFYNIFFPVHLHLICLEDDRKFKIPEAFYWISPSLFPSNDQAAQSWLCISLSVSEQLCSKFYLIITINSVFKSHWSTNRVIDSQPVDRGNISLYLKSMPLLSLLASSANHGSFLAKFSPPGLLIIVKDSSWSKACSFHHLTSSLLTKKCCVRQRQGDTVCLGLQFKMCFFSKSWICFRHKPLMSFRR